MLNCKISFHDEFATIEIEPFFQMVKEAFEAELQMPAPQHELHALIEDVTNNHVDGEWTGAHFTFLVDPQNTAIEFNEDDDGRSVTIPTAKLIQLFKDWNQAFPQDEYAL